MKNKTAYLYLARRDKKGAKLVARLQSSIDVVSRVENIGLLNLPPNIENDVKKIAYDNRMQWELWIETIDSYESLRKSLAKRGYTQVSLNPVPMLSGMKLKVNEVKLNKPPKTMISRKRG